jgi:hypothetical protein
MTADNDSRTEHVYKPLRIPLIIESAPRGRVWFSTVCLTGKLTPSRRERTPDEAGILRLNELDEDPKEIGDVVVVETPREVRSDRAPINRPHAPLLFPPAIGNTQELATRVIFDRFTANEPLGHHPIKQTGQVVLGEQHAAMQVTMPESTFRGTHEFQ